MPEALAHKKIVKKRTARFTRFQVDRFKRMTDAWRHPRGIDSPMRRQFLGQKPLVSIGYGSDKQTRYMLRNGFYPQLIHNLKELEALKTLNREICAVIAHGVSAHTQQKILEEAQKLDILVVNANRRVKKENQ